MMVSERISLLLFVLLMGSCLGLYEEELIKVPEKTETPKEGSCVLIPCAYKAKIYENMKLLWFKDPLYDNVSKTFNGTIVYSNKAEHPQSPGYSSRVEFITDVTSQTDQNSHWIKCDLRMTDLQKTDSGNYSFRFISSDRYMSKAMKLAVTDNPCKVQIEPSALMKTLNASDELTVKCSTSGSCASHPKWLVHTTGQKQEWISSSSADMIIKTEEKGDRKITTLKLKVTMKDDNRILSCRPAESDDSCQIRKITLSVDHAPADTTATVSSKFVKEGDSVTLSCSSRGRPDVSFTWFKNEIKQESQQMSDWTLTDVKPEDSGEYYCEAKNKHGQMKSNTITIDVKYGPKYVTAESESDVNNLKEGDKLTLKCSVKESNPTVSHFTWYKNSNVIQQTGDRLIISQLKPDDGGTYYCQANNGIKSEKSNKITVSVQYSPRNIQIGGSASVKVGTSLTLTCSADANPEPNSYMWTFPPGLSSPPSSNTKKLHISTVTIQHAGQYTCDVTNTIGNGSHNININVLYPPSNLSLIMKSEVREFELISIICSVQSFPHSQLTVTGPQGDLTNIQKHRGHSSESMNKLTVFLNITESDDGQYKCKAGNSEGKNETQKEMTVLYAPKDVQVSSEGEEAFGSELTLTCKARSKPAPSSYEWKKRLSGQLKTAGREQKLHFHPLEISDSGQYVCIAQNRIGKNESQNVDIRVKHAPSITIIHNMTTFSQWKFPVSLSCSAHAFPPATDYKWYREEKNTTILSHQQNFTVQPQDPGTYYCTAANNIGSSQSNHIRLFVSNSLIVYLIIPIILLLILIFVAIFLIHRTFIKRRSDQPSGADNPLRFFSVFASRTSTGSRNNTQENLTMEDPGYRGVHQSHPTPRSQDPSPAQGLNPSSKPNIHTIYSAIKLPHMKQEKRSPKQQKNMDNNSATSTLNYVTIDFNGQKEPAKRAPQSSPLYAMVSKTKKAENSTLEHHDYENVSSACAPKHPFTNMDWESDTSEEDEVSYTAVSYSVKPAVKEPKQTQKSESSSSSDEEDRTEYSAIKP